MAAENGVGRTGLRSIIPWMFLILLSILSFSVNASANPASGMFGRALLPLYILFFINFPINLLMYFSFLWLLIPKDRFELFANPPVIYVLAGILVVFWASAFGVVIDFAAIMIFYPAFGVAGLAVGLALIFLSFLGLSLGLHRLPTATSVYVALLIVVVNIPSWSFFLMIEFQPSFFVPIFVIFFLVAQSAVYIFHRLYANKRNSDIKRLEEEARGKDPMSVFPAHGEYERHRIRSDDILGAALVLCVLLPLLVFISIL